jgi:hypothetical protein
LNYALGDVFACDLTSELSLDLIIIGSQLQVQDAFEGVLVDFVVPVESFAVITQFE